MLYAGPDIHKAVFQAVVLDPESGGLRESRFAPSRERLADWAMQWQGKLASPLQDQPVLAQDDHRPPRCAPRSRRWRERRRPAPTPSHAADALAVAIWLALAPPLLRQASSSHSAA